MTWTALLFGLLGLVICGGVGGLVLLGWCCCVVAARSERLIEEEDYQHG